MKKTLSFITIISVIAFFSPAPHAYADSIARDNFTSAQISSASPLSQSFTTAGVNRFLIASCASSNGDIASTPTYNGVSMKLAVKQQVAATPNWAYFWYLANPTVGANTFSAGFSGSSGDYTCNLASYTGVSQTTAPDVHSDSETLQSGDRTTNVTVTNTGSWMAGSHIDTVSAATAGVNCSLYAGNGIAFANIVCDTNGTVSSGVQTIGFHYNVADTHSLTGMAFAPATTSVARFFIFSGWF